MNAYINIGRDFGYELKEFAPGLELAVLGEMYNTTNEPAKNILITLVPVSDQAKTYFEFDFWVEGVEESTFKNFVISSFSGTNIVSSIIICSIVFLCCCCCFLRSARSHISNVKEINKVQIQEKSIELETNTATRKGIPVIVMAQKI